MDHNAYLLQFSDKNDTLNLYFNIECPDEEADEMANKLYAAASQKQMHMIRKGHYELAEKPDNNLEVKFSMQRKHKQSQPCRHSLPRTFTIS